MLQQTQVKTVLPRFQVFIARYPSVQAIAAASEEQICEAFAGLGYYHRARNLHRAAYEIVHDLKGCFPTTYAGLRSLPGVGDYTAAAVASIAFKEKAAAVDGNLLRVIARVFKLPGARREKPLVAAVRKLADELVQDQNPGDVNQALMDLGASVCTSTGPSCSNCPLRRFCKAFAIGRPENFPQPGLKVSRKRLPIVFAWVKRGKMVLVEKRPLTGLWPGLWELPSETGVRAKNRLEERLGIKLGPAEVQLRHLLSHREVLASVCKGKKNTTLEGKRELPQRKFTSSPLEMPLSTLARKAIQAMIVEK
jgi:A/G-specific adenine glycosylase